MGYSGHRNNTNRSRFATAAFSYRCLNDTDAKLRGPPDAPGSDAAHDDVTTRETLRR